MLSGLIKLYGVEDSPPLWWVSARPGVAPGVPTNGRTKICSSSNESAAEGERFCFVPPCTARAPNRCSLELRRQRLCQSFCILKLDSLGMVFDCLWMPNLNVKFSVCVIPDRFFNHETLVFLCVTFLMGFSWSLYFDQSAHVATVEKEEHMRRADRFKVRP